MRLRLTVAYDGTPYAGWQSQLNGEAVQDVLEAAVEKIGGKRVTVHGSGRTDAGVHALRQSAHFEAEKNSLKPEDWQRALNATLPASIRVMRCTKAREDFHARFQASGKIYRYLIRNDAVLPPHEKDRVWHVPHPLDDRLLKNCAKLFTGRHDFAGFSANRSKTERNTVRTIDGITVTRRGSLVTLTFEGEGFLYKMVRMLTGAMARCAQGREDIDALKARLKNGQPRWNHVAPAEGLYLVRVLYGDRGRGESEE